MICCGNYYLCKVKHKCDDVLECHALARAVLGSMEDRYRRCRVVQNQGNFHYEFEERLPTYDFRAAIRKEWRKNKRKKETTK